MLLANFGISRVKITYSAPQGQRMHFFVETYEFVRGAVWVFGLSVDGVLKRPLAPPGPAVITSAS